MEEERRVFSGTITLFSPSLCPSFPPSLLIFFHGYFLDHGHDLLPVHEVVTGKLLALLGLVRKELEGLVVSGGHALRRVGKL